MLSSSPAGADELFAGSRVQGIARGMVGEGKGERGLRYVLSLTMKILVF